MQQQQQRPVTDINMNDTTSKKCYDKKKALAAAAPDATLTVEEEALEAAAKAKRAIIQQKSRAKVKASVATAPRLAAFFESPLSASSLNKLTIAQLLHELRRRGLKVSFRKKQELILRLLGASTTTEEEESTTEEESTASVASESAAAAVAATSSINDVNDDTDEEDDDDDDDDDSARSSSSSRNRKQKPSHRSVIDCMDDTDDEDTDDDDDDGDVGIISSSSVSSIVSNTTTTTSNTNINMNTNTNTASDGGGDGGDGGNGNNGNDQLLLDGNLDVDANGTAADDPNAQTLLTNNNNNDAYSQMLADMIADTLNTPAIIASPATATVSAAAAADVAVDVVDVVDVAAIYDYPDSIIGGVLYNDIITEIHDHDVLCGRGRGEYHSGNIWFRRLLRENISLYQNSPKHTKRLIAQQVVAAFTKQRSPPGRFIKASTKDDSGVVVGWIQLTHKQAIAKANHTLRDNQLSPTNTSPQPTTFVNGKQYCRILKRREARAKMEEYLTKKRAMNLLSSSSSSGETITTPPTTEAVTTATATAIAILPLVTLLPSPATATAIAILPLVTLLPSPVAGDAVAKKRRCDSEYYARKRQKREEETDEEEKIRLKKLQLVHNYRRMLFGHSNKKYNPPFLHKEFNEAEFPIRMTHPRVLEPFAKWVLDVTHDQITKLPLDKMAQIDHMHGLPGYIHRSQDGMFRCLCSSNTNTYIGWFERVIATNSTSSVGTADITAPYDIMNVKNETFLADVTHMLTVIIPALKKEWKEAPIANKVREEEIEDRGRIVLSRNKSQKTFRLGEWSKKEKEYILKGLSEKGWGQWKMFTRHYISTRSSGQCKRWAEATFKNNEGYLAWKIDEYFYDDDDSDDDSDVGELARKNDEFDHDDDDSDDDSDDGELD